MGVLLSKRPRRNKNDTILLEHSTSKEEESPVCKVMSKTINPELSAIDRGEPFTLVINNHATKSMDHGANARGEARIMELERRLYQLETALFIRESRLQQQEARLQQHESRLQWRSRR